MSLDGNTRELLMRGIAAAKTNDIKEARFYLEWALRLDPPMDERLEVWYWLSRISTDPKEKRGYLEDILANDLGNGRARRDLAVLDGRLKPEDMINPDTFKQARPGAPQASASDRFTCPKCGGRMTFTPDGQSLTCEYCEVQSQITKGKKETPGDDFVVAMATGKGFLKPVTVRSLTCQGCGAVFILPPEQLSLTCPYCDSPHVLRQTETRQVAAPHSIIPFKLTHEQAGEAVRTWAADELDEGIKNWAPLQGIYLPAWSFNVGGQVPWRCLLQTEDDKWAPASGIQVVQMSHLLVLATSRPGKAFQAAVASYNLGDLVDYDERYLANWLAETFQVAPGDASLEARRMAFTHQQELIASSFGQPVRDLNISSANMIVESFSLILLPAWSGHYIHADRRYELFINGQTGQVLGEKPPRGLRDWVNDLLSI